MRFFFFLLSLLLFSGCATSSLKYRSNAISIQMPGFEKEFQGETLHTVKKNLSPISLEQRVFASGMNETLVYEHARLATGYKFKYSYSYILDKVFDAKRVHRDRNKNGLGFFTVELKDGSTLFVLLKTTTKKSLTMLYGLSQTNYQALMNQAPLHRLEQHPIQPEKAIKSQWNAKMIIEGVLLDKEGGKILYL